MTKNKDARRADNFAEEQRDGLEPDLENGVEGQPDSITSSRFEPVPGYSTEQLERARDTVRDAWVWRKSNPRAWNHLVVTAIILADKEQRVGVRGLVEEVRRKDFADVYGIPTVTNNSFEPVFARWLIAEHPRLKGYVETRASALDVVMGGVGR